MVNPTILSRPKPIAFSISAASGPIRFEVWNVTQGEIIKTDNDEKTLETSATGKGSFDMSWFTSWVVGDKIIVSYAGKTYGGASLTLTSASVGSQKISAITAVTTALPAFNM